MLPQQGLAVWRWQGGQGWLRPSSASQFSPLVLGSSLGRQIPEKRILWALPIESRSAGVAHGKRLWTAAVESGLPHKGRKVGGCSVGRVPLWLQGLGTAACPFAGTSLGSVLVFDVPSKGTNVSLSEVLEAHSDAVTDMGAELCRQPVRCGPDSLSRAQALSSPFGPGCGLASPWALQVVASVALLPAGSLCRLAAQHIPRQVLGLEGFPSCPLGCPECCAGAFVPSGIAAPGPVLLPWPQ